MSTDERGESTRTHTHMHAHAHARTHARIHASLCFPLRPFSFLRTPSLFLSLPFALADMRPSFSFPFFPFLSFPSLLSLPFFPSSLFSPRSYRRYFTPSQVDERNRRGECQHGMRGSQCDDHACESDDTNLIHVDYSQPIASQQAGMAGDVTVDVAVDVAVDSALTDDVAQPLPDVWGFTFRFPGTKEKDSEALAVAPDGSRFWLWEKNEESTGANVYESDLLSDAIARGGVGGGVGGWTALALHGVGLIRPPCIAAGSQCAEWGEDHLFSITGADVHPAGASIVLQTYKVRPRASRATHTRTHTRTHARTHTCTRPNAYGWCSGATMHVTCWNVEC